MNYSFEDFQAEYPTDGECLDKIMRIQFGGTEIICPSCKKMSQFYRVPTKLGYYCKACEHNIYPCSGTIFDKTTTDLKKWFYGIYIMASTGHVMSAKELQKQLHISYKCAWQMAYELRRLYAVSHQH